MDKIVHFLILVCSKKAYQYSLFRTSVVILRKDTKNEIKLQQAFLSSIFRHVVILRKDTKNEIKLQLKQWKHLQRQSCNLT